MDQLLDQLSNEWVLLDQYFRNARTVLYIRQESSSSESQCTYEYEYAETRQLRRIS